MTRELLERAAMAMGLGLIGPVERYIAQPNPQHVSGFLIRNDKGGDSAWNPLTDDADCFRMETELRHKIGSPIWTGGGVSYIGHDDEEYRERFANHPDYNAARRMAALRAAASLPPKETK